MGRRRAALQRDRIALTNVGHRDGEAGDAGPAPGPAVVLLGAGQLAGAVGAGDGEEDVVADDGGVEAPSLGDHLVGGAPLVGGRVIHGDGVQTLAAIVPS